MIRFRPLERFVRRQPGDAAGERCELCAGPLGARHRHVVEIARGAVRCACGACGVLFTDAGSGGGRWRTVPDRVAADPSFAPTDGEWAAAGIPVRLACILHRSAARAWIALYPSPGGPIEAELDEDAWRTLAAPSPLVAGLAPDVEALVVRRPRGGGAGGGASDCFVAPVDVGYELVALVRRHWRGFDGGDEAARALDEFFAGLRARAAGGGAR